MLEHRVKRARPSRICFYRLDSEDEKLTTSTEGLVLWSVRGEAKDAFLADVAPILTVQLRQEMIDEIARIEQEVDFSGDARRDIDRLVEWIMDSSKPVIGFQQERVDPEAPNVPAPEALEERDDVLVFYLLDSSESQVFEDQDSFTLRTLMGAFDPDIEPYLTVEDKRDLLDRIPSLLTEFGADENTKKDVAGLVAWLENSTREFVGFQYEPEG